MKDEKTYRAHTWKEVKDLHRKLNKQFRIFGSENQWHDPCCHMCGYCPNALEAIVEADKEKALRDLAESIKNIPIVLRLNGTSTYWITDDWDTPGITQEGIDYCLAKALSKSE